MTLIVMVQRSDLALLAADTRVLRYEQGDEALASTPAPAERIKVRKVGDAFTVVTGLEGTIAEDVRLELAGCRRLDRAAVGRSLHRWHAEHVPSMSDQVGDVLSRSGKVFAVRPGDEGPEALGFGLDGTPLWVTAPLLLETDGEAMLLAPAAGPVIGPDAPPGMWALVQQLARAVRAPAGHEAVADVVLRFFGDVYRAWSSPAGPVGDVVSIAVITAAGPIYWPDATQARARARLREEAL